MHFGRNDDAYDVKLECYVSNLGLDYSYNGGFLVVFLSTSRRIPVFYLTLFMTAPFYSI